MPQPVVIMVAGPNGAGKSSIAPGLVAEAMGIVEYVNADTIARGLSAFDPDRAAIAAGRIMLHHLKELASDGVSFAFETTGASRSFARWLQSLQQSGYRFLLTYLWVQSPELSVARVTQRVSLGGHSVPEPTIRRRYTRGLLNFFDLYLPLADEWRLYDNSGAGEAILVAEGGKQAPETVLEHEIWRKIQQAARSARETG